MRARTAPRSFFMMLSNNDVTKKVVLLAAWFCFINTMPLQANQNTKKSSVINQEPDDIDEDEEQAEEQPRRINNIIITGNKHVPSEAILDRLPFQKGEIFDSSKTRALISNLYKDLKRFRNITVKTENIGTNLVNLHIHVDEKKTLKEVIIEGNKQVTTKEIYDKINFNEIPAIDAEELKKFAVLIKKLYIEKGYHQTEITTELRLEDTDKATALITINEKPQSLVKRILFKGNNNITSKQLRSIIFTREDWIGGFMDKSGTYQPDRIAGDKHMIEQYYQNHGYINAKVIDVETITDPVTKNITLIYEVFEGDCYTIKDVAVQGNGILNEAYLLEIIPVKPGDIYSREKLVDTMKTLETLWGDLGYIYAHIDPMIQTNDDEKTVSITFETEQGNQVFLNKITIRGNKKTRDKIIRRKISLEEGGLITNAHMDASKNRIEGLGYFDQRDGVTWKTTRLSENSADLDLILKEIKTGDAHFKIGFGGAAANLHSSSSSVSVEGNVSDTNLGGSGIRVNLNGKLGTDEKTVIFNITEPWLFDKPVYGSLDLYHKRYNYDQFNLTLPVDEKDTGGVITTGFMTNPFHQIFSETFVRFSLGGDSIDYGTIVVDNNPCPRRPRANIPALCNDPSNLLHNQAVAAYDTILAQEFDPGSFFTFTTAVGQDKRNHPMHPTNGHAWTARSIFAWPILQTNLGFYKFDVDFNWFTPLIGNYNLIFRLHTYLGIITPFSHRTVPYRELFHIGGPASVRGYLFGQIGPQFTVSDTQNALRQDSIGGDKAFFLNAELIFPILSDFSMKGLLFYDGGTGWDNPYVNKFNKEFVINNHFSYRHSIGIGLRILNPIPLRIDWGFKLDPHPGEPAYEVHFGMTYDW